MGAARQEGCAVSAKPDCTREPGGSSFSRTIWKKKEENGEIPSLTLELWCTSVIA